MLFLLFSLNNQQLIDSSTVHIHYFELMTHRRDLVVLHTTDSKEKVLQIIDNEHFSKYLLIDDDTDEIAGVVSVKDIILMIGSEQEFNLREIARPALGIRPIRNIANPPKVVKSSDSISS